jgi:hypothetical protein
MKTNEQHVSDDDLNHLINDWRHDVGDAHTDHLILPALLELKKRREADRVKPENG